MTQTQINYDRESPQSPTTVINNYTNVTIIKSLGDQESYDSDKIRIALSRAIGSRKDKDKIINEIVNFVESKIDFTPGSLVTTGYINTLIEAYMRHKVIKGFNDYNIFLEKYVNNKIKKQNEAAIKVSHLHSTIKNGHNMSSLKKFTSNQTMIAAARYLLRDLETGEVKESIDEWFDRVASCVVLGSIMYDEYLYDKEGKLLWEPEYHVNNHECDVLKDYQVKIIEDFYKRYSNHMTMSLHGVVDWIDSIGWDKYAELKQRYKDLMLNGVFMPNTPTLMNAGSGSGGLSACFTLDVEDNMASIAQKIWPSAAFIFKMAGGLGVNVSKIRPADSPVSDTHGAATGPINLVLEAVDNITDIVKSGGKRRGANMGIMEYWHPQILEFIDYKTVPGKLENFNVSVMFDEDFWHHYFNNETVNLQFNDKIFGLLNARDLIDKIANNAWKSAEPGVLFKDNMNKKNPLRSIWGDIHITNPCSEQAMYDGESCTLGSINLAKFVDYDNEDNPTFNFNDFQKIVHLTTQFLNDVLEINKYPTEYIQQQSEKTRRIGLGIMGFADMLFKLRIPFNSEQAYTLSNMLGSSLYWESVAESKRLAGERGSCPVFEELVKSGTKPEDIVNRIYNTKTFSSSDEIMQNLDKGVRNAWTTTIAPTGTISMIANCSNGLEPVFALVYKKTVSTGDHYYLNEEFKKALIQEGIYDDEIIKQVEANYGSCQGIERIPRWIQDVFVTAIDLHWTDHLISQAIWQQNIDNSISKTINMPHNATPSSIKYAYLLAHELGLKGVSVYRDGCRDKQIMHTNTSVKSDDKTIGVKAIVNTTIQKKSEPSQATLEYIWKNVKNQTILNEIIQELNTTQQVFLKDNKEECPSCKKGVIVNQAGCKSCNVCGYSLSCSVG